jgi:predicted enzyme related to lactoylglutathione lyase
MIFGAHAIVYARDAERARAFFRDTLEMANVDAGEGWLIFRLPPGEMGVHPTMESAEDGSHELYLMCDDVKRTVSELGRKGVQFTKPVQDHGWGLLTYLRVPGGGELGLYQPRHPTAIDAKGARAPRPRKAPKKAAKKAPKRASGRRAKSRPHARAKR